MATRSPLAPKPAPPVATAGSAKSDPFSSVPDAPGFKASAPGETTNSIIRMSGAKKGHTWKAIAILASVGHFNGASELGALAEMAKGRREIRRFVEEYQLPDKKVFVLAEGRLLNHVAAEANPAAVMDMSFANQVLSIEYLLLHGNELEPRVYPVPRELDEEIARRKLEAMGMHIDTMSKAQSDYARSWKAGT